jgi:hypothetical protein
MTLTASEIAELNRRICVMIAFRDGRPIEAISKEYENDNWQQTKYPSWNWLKADFRIAPEPRKPRECWVIFPLNYPHPRVIGGATKIDAMLSAVEGGDEVVHMREVLPDHLPNSFAGVGLVRAEAKRDAVIIQLIDGDRVVSIECLNREMLPTLQLEAQRILRE